MEKAADEGRMEKQREKDEEALSYCELLDVVCLNRAKTAEQLCDIRAPSEMTKPTLPSLDRKTFPERGKQWFSGNVDSLINLQRLWRDFLLFVFPFKTAKI